MPNDTSKHRAKNRQVETIVLKSSVKAELTQSIEQLNENYESVEGKITDAQKE